MRERLQRSSSGKRGESTFGTQCAVEEASTHGRSLEQDHANVGGGGGENASPSAFAHNSATPDHHHPTASTPAFNAPDTVPSTLTPQGANWEAQGFEEAIFRTITQPLPRFRVVDTVRVTAPFIISSQGVDVVSADSKGAPETPIVPNQDSEQVNVAKSLPDSFHSAKSVSASPTTTSDIPDVNMHAFGAISGIEAGLDPLSASGHASPPASHASAQATPRPQKIKSGPLSPESPKTPLNLRATVETAIQPAIPVTPAPCLPVHPATPRPSFHDGNSTQQSQKIAGAVRNVNTHPDKFLRHMFSAAQNWGGGGGSSGLKLHERRLSLSPPMERAASDCEGGSTILSAPSAPLTSTEIPSAALEAWNISACTVELEMPLSSGKGTFEPPMNASPICASQEKSFPVQASPPSTNKPVNPLKGHEAPNWSEMSSPSLTSLPPVKKSRLPKCAKDSLNLFPVSSTNSKGQNEKRSPRGLFEAVGTVRLGSGNSSLQRLNSHQGPAEDESLSRWDATTSLSVPGNGAKDTPKTPPSENIFAAEDSSEPSFMSVLKSDAIMPMQAHDIDSKASVQPSSVVLKGNNVEVNFGSVTSSPKIVSEMLKTLNLTSTETLDHDEGSEWRSATMQEHVPKPRLISSPPTPPTVERSENISPHSTNPDPHDNSMQETINIFSHMVHDIPNWGERGATHDDSARKNLPTKRAHKAHEHTKPLQHRHKDSHWQRQSRPGQAERRDPSISFADLSAAGTTEDRTASWASDQRHRQMNLHDSNEPSLMPIMDPENQDENASPVQPRRDIAVNAASVGPFSIQSSSTEQSLEYALDDARFITDVSCEASLPIAPKEQPIMSFSSDGNSPGIPSHIHQKLMPSATPINDNLKSGSGMEGVRNVRPRLSSNGNLQAEPRNNQTGSGPIFYTLNELLQLRPSLTQNLLRLIPVEDASPVQTNVPRPQSGPRTSSTSSTEERKPSHVSGPQAQDIRETPLPSELPTTFDEPLTQKVEIREQPLYLDANQHDLLPYAPQKTTSPLAQNGQSLRSQGPQGQSLRSPPTHTTVNESFVGPNFHAYSALSKELDSEFVISGNEVNVRYTKGLFVPTAGTVLNPALLAEEMSRQQQSKALPIIPPQISAHTDTQTIKKSVTDHVCVVAKTPSPPTYVSAAIGMSKLVSGSLSRLGVPFAPIHSSVEVPAHPIQKSAPESPSLLSRLGSPVTLRQSYAPQSPSMTAFPQKRTSQAIALSSPNMQTNVLSHQESPVSDLLPAPFFQPPFLLPPAQGPTNSCQNNPPAAPTVATKPPLVPSVTMSSANGLRAISSSDQDNSPLVPMGATSTTAPRTLSAALEAPPPKIKPLVPLRLPGQGSSNHQVFMFSGVPKFTEDGRVIALNDEDRKQRPVIEKPELSFLHGTGEYVPRAGRYIAPVESSYVDDENFYGRSGSSIHRSSIGHERPSTSSINQRSSHSSTSSTASYGNRTSMPAAPYGTRSANSILHRATTGTASSTSTYEHQGIPSESVSSAYFSTYSSSAYDTRSTTQPSGSGSLAQNGIGSCR